MILNNIVYFQRKYNRFTLLQKFVIFRYNKNKSKKEKKK